MLIAEDHLRSAAQLAFERLDACFGDCQAVVFDLGGVLIAHDNAALARRLAQACRAAHASPVALERAIAMSGTSNGSRSVPEFHAWLVREHGLVLPYVDFLDVWNSHLGPIAPMLACLARLAKTRSLYVLSNTNREHWACISHQWLDLSAFRGLFLSYELGLQKPEPEIFAKALAEIGRHPSECAFIDDAPQNVAQAEALGMRAVLCRLGGQLGAEVPELEQAHPTDLGVSASTKPQLLDEVGQRLFHHLDELAGVQRGRPREAAAHSQEGVPLNRGIRALERLAEGDESAGHVASLFTQLAQRSGLRRLARLDATSRQLVQDSVGTRPVLARQHDAIFVSESKHRNDAALALERERAHGSVRQLEGDVFNAPPRGMHVNAALQYSPTLDTHAHPARQSPNSVPARLRDRVQVDIPLAPFTTLKLGGPARFLFDAESETDAVAALEWAAQQRLPVAVLGGGSNVVVSDAGFDGLVLRLRTSNLHTTYQADDPLLVADAGLPFDELIAHSVRGGLVGLECLSGIPGTVGAAPVQNVSAYGQQVSDSLAFVRAFDRHQGRVRVLSASACELSHRSSVFKRRPKRFLILAVAFRLQRGSVSRPTYAEVQQRLSAGSATPAAVRAAVMAIRREKSMLLDERDPNGRSVGSFFVSPVLPRRRAELLVGRAVARGVVARATDVPVLPVDAEHCRIPGGWLIERVGYRRGLRERGVGLSTRHALSLVHDTRGTSHALMELAARIQDSVLATFDIRLEPEPTFFGAPSSLTHRLWNKEVS
jgi:UDP-N-acetylmuramate dehydrogenase